MSLKDIWQWLGKHLSALWNWLINADILVGMKVLGGIVGALIVYVVVIVSYSLARGFRLELRERLHAKYGNAPVVIDYIFIVLCLISSTFILAAYLSRPRFDDFMAAAALIVFISLLVFLVFRKEGQPRSD